MKQITEYSKDVRTVLDTDAKNPTLTIQTESGLVVITRQHQDLIHAIRSGLSKLLDSAKS